MIAAALAHVALTKCKWRHPSNCRQKGNRGQLSDRRLQDRLKPNYPFVSSGRSINPTRVNVRACERENVARESQSRFLTSICVHSECRANCAPQIERKFSESFRPFVEFLKGGALIRPDAETNILFTDKMQSHRRSYKCSFISHEAKTYSLQHLKHKFFESERWDIL